MRLCLPRNLLVPAPSRISLHIDGRAPVVLGRTQNRHHSSVMLFYIIYLGETIEFMRTIRHAPLRSVCNCRFKCCGKGARQSVRTMPSPSARRVHRVRPGRRQYEHFDKIKTVNK